MKQIGLGIKQCVKRSWKLGWESAEKLISASEKYVFLFLRENQAGDELVRVNSSYEGCTKENKKSVGIVSIGT